MKKMIAMLLVLALAFTLYAAGAPELNAPEAQPTTTPAKDRTGIPASVTLSDSKALEGKKIGCSIVYKGDEWCYAVSTALETLGKYYGADIVVEDGDLNDETVTKQLENMVANNCDIIMVDPVTPDGSHEALMGAVEAGIPVIIYDGYWSAGDEYALTTVTWDQKATGTLIGNYFVDYIRKNNNSKARVIELNNVVSIHTQDRFVGLHEVFDNTKDCDIKVLNQYDSNGNREVAYNAIAAIAEPYDYIISDVDNGAQGAVAALQAAGNDRVKVFSMGAYGAEPFGLLHEHDPNYIACVNVDAWILAQFIMQSAIDHFEGKDVPIRTNIDLYVVDSNNVEDFWSFS